jgi:hypothetical protein
LGSFNSLFIEILTVFQLKVVGATVQSSNGTTISTFKITPKRYDDISYAGLILALTSTKYKMPRFEKVQHHTNSVALHIF